MDNSINTVSFPGYSVMGTGASSSLSTSVPGSLNLGQYAGADDFDCNIVEVGSQSLVDETVGRVVRDMSGLLDEKHSEELASLLKKSAQLIS